jgi:hypothetical protein
MPDPLSPLLLFDDSKSLAGSFEWVKESGLLPTDAIDLWLNTRYHHVGRKQSHRFTRDDFDRFSQDMGPVLFEFFFLQSIHEFGISLFNVLQCAEGFLATLADQGVHPSFQFISTKDNRIERATPGYTPEENNPSQRVWRLRRRQIFSGISYLLELINFSNEDAAQAIHMSESFDEFADSVGIAIEHAEDFESARTEEDFVAFGGCIDNQMTAYKNQKCRRGFVGKRRNSTLVCGEDFLPIIRDQYAEFREAFTREPFQ